MSDVICENCKYYADIGSGVYGFCHRYPDKIGKEWDDWCGEFQLHEA